MQKARMRTFAEWKESLPRTGSTGYAPLAFIARTLDKVDLAVARHRLHQVEKKASTRSGGHASTSSSTSAYANTNADVPPVLLRQLSPTRNNGRRSMDFPSSTSTSPRTTATATLSSSEKNHRRMSIEEKRRSLDLTTLSLMGLQLRQRSMSVSPNSTRTSTSSVSSGTAVATPTPDLELELDDDLDEDESDQDDSNDNDQLASPLFSPGIMRPMTPSPDYIMHVSPPIATPQTQTEKIENDIDPRIYSLRHKISTLEYRIQESSEALSQRSPPALSLSPLLAAIKPRKSIALNLTTPSTSLKAYQSPPHLKSILKREPTLKHNMDDTASSNHSISIKDGRSSAGGVSMMTRSFTSTPVTPKEQRRRMQEAGVRFRWHVDVVEFVVYEMDDDDEDPVEEDTVVDDDDDVDEDDIFGLEEDDTSEGPVKDIPIRVDGGLPVLAYSGH